MEPRERTFDTEFGLTVLRCGKGSILYEIQKYDEVALPRLLLKDLHNTIEGMNCNEKDFLCLYVTDEGISIKGKKIKVYDLETLRRRHEFVAENVIIESARTEHIREDRPVLDKRYLLLV